MLPEVGPEGYQDDGGAVFGRADGVYPRRTCKEAWQQKRAAIP